MKKAIVVVMVLGLVAAAVMFSMAATPMEQEMAKGKQMMDMPQGCMMMSSTGKMMMGCPMHGMMMHNMMSCQMVATEDGGVIIMHFGKLTKYDKELNMVKEVDMKMDPEAMKKMMTQMMEMCPMCKKMTEKAEMMEKGKMMEKTMK